MKRPKFEGLNTFQKKWANDKVKEFKKLGVGIPFDAINEEAKLQECKHEKQYYCLVTGGGRCRTCKKLL